MLNLVLLSAISFLISSYILGCIIKFGIPNSLSETYYSLGKYGWIFQLVMLIVGVVLQLLWFPLSKEEHEFLVFLACASLCFVASAPAFRIEIQGKVHYSAAAVCCISVFSWQILEGLWDVMLWFVWVGGMITLMNRSKWCWWLECAAIGSLFANLWRII